MGLNSVAQLGGQEDILLSLVRCFNSILYHLKVSIYIIYRDF